MGSVKSRVSKTQIPTHIKVTASETGLPKDSVVLLEQVRTMDKSRLRNKVGTVNSLSMSQIDNAVSVSFGLCPARIA
jgi:mRNA interferase MazF